MPPVSGPNRRGHARIVRCTATGTLELTLPPEPGSVAEARSRVLDAVGPELDSEQEQTLRLLVSEVVTNAVRHGGQLTTRSSCTPPGTPRCASR